MLPLSCPTPIWAMRSLVLSFFAVTAAACGSSGGPGPADAGPTDAGPTDAGPVDAGPSDAGPADASSCAATCGDAGVCVGEVCCAASSACGTVCCAASEVCAFGACATPSTLRVDATVCGPDAYCDYTLGDPSSAPDAGAACPGGAPSGRCLPMPPTCPTGTPPGDPITCHETCEVRPTTGTLSPTLEYSWGDPAAPLTRDSVMMAPVVIQLDDDTCDGVVDQRDTPEIVFFTFASGNYNGDGTLHAISIVDGAVVEKWSANAGATSPNHPGRSIAAGNIDGVPGNEIVVCTTDLRVRAYRADGTVLWLSAPTSVCAMPAIANLDQDTTVEVIVEGAVLDGASGAIELPISPPFGSLVVADVTGDGRLDLVGPDRVLDADGTVVATTAAGGRYVAVGDLDRSGLPEIVVGDFNTHTLLVWRVNPAEPDGSQVVRQGVDINGSLSPTLCSPSSVGRTRGGGPPTIADYNGDGTPDVGLAGGVGYAVFDGARLTDSLVANPATLLWARQTQDCSSAFTGSTAFDFEGDGRAEVVYADELRLHVYDGLTGDVLFETCNTSGTLFEYPVIADVDGDAQADLVVPSSSYSSFTCDGAKTAGIRVFGDAGGNWVRTRRVWNEHGYHVTNVAEDGTIPRIEAPNYLEPALNDFRRNVLPGGEFAAPDLVVTVAPRCGAMYTVVATVRNVGKATAPRGVPVAFYAGDPTAGGALLGTAATTRALDSAEAQRVELPLTVVPPEVASGSVALYAVLDAAASHAWRECRTGNNTSAPASSACGRE
jgi:hypothetical protein